MSEPQTNPLWPWIVALLIGLPLLYIFSSGPTRSVAFHQSSTGTGLGLTVVDADEWWFSLYGPLIWGSQQSWGEPLIWYWEMFPILDATPGRR